MVESKNGFVILIIRILHYQKKKPEDPEKDHLPWQRTYPRATSETKKKQQTDPHGEDKKKKQHKLWMNIYEMFILRFETQMFLEYNTLLRIVKL